MALSPVTERRIVTFLPPLFVAALLIPFALRQNAWYEWQNAYWFLQRQSAYVSAHGTPTFFLHTKDGTFYPFFLFYGGFTIGLLAYPAALFGAWPVFLASMVAAVVGGYLGIWWTARNLGLSRRLAVLPALIYATTPYVLSDAYGRGAWAELVGVNAVAVLLGGWTALLRPAPRHRGLALAALAGSSAIVAGTHNVTLLLTAAVLPLIVLALLPFTAGRSAGAELLPRLGRGVVVIALGAGLTAAWLIPNIWLGSQTFITDAASNQLTFVGTASFESITNLLSPWPVVPHTFKGAMWIYAQAPTLAIFWVLVAFALTLIGSRRRGTPRGVVASSAALIVLGAGLLVVISHPLWWSHFPRLVQTVQMPMRMVPFVAIVTALAVTVLVAGLGQRRARRPLMATLVVAVAAQALMAIYVATSGHPGVAYSAPIVRHAAVKVREEPSPFSGPQEMVALQFRVAHKPRGPQKPVLGIPSRMSDALTSNRAKLQGAAKVGDQVLTDIVASPLVQISGDARVAGRTDSGMTLIRIIHTNAQGGFTATVRSQCTVCLTTTGSGWQLWLGRLITLLSAALLLAAGVVSLRRALRERGRRVVVAQEDEPQPAVPIDEHLPVVR
jgi:hypothetical protein